MTVNQEHRPPRSDLRPIRKTGSGAAKAALLSGVVSETADTGHAGELSDHTRHNYVSALHGLDLDDLLAIGPPRGYRRD